VAILVHDIRTPLNLISLAGSALQEGVPLDARQERQVSRIMQGVKRITRLIDDLAILVRSRIGSPVPLTKAAVDLGVICQQALEEVKASHQHVSFGLQITENLTGHWDSERLAQVISNLTSNAVIHAAAPAVQVSIQDKDQEVVLEVTNNGIPIPAEVQESIFEPLVHQGGSSGSLSSGLGLGLFIVREIVTAHGGRVTVMSDESSGTTFTVRLPRVHSG
jgi:signal transduction histidine kinase